LYYKCIANTPFQAGDLLSDANSPIGKALFSLLTDIVGNSISNSVSSALRPVMTPEEKESRVYRHLVKVLFPVINVS